VLHQSIRVLAFGFGALLFLGGLVAISAGGPAAVSGLWSVALAAAIMVAAVLQRSGYRSEAAERSHAAPGPGGGEDGNVEPRFAPTNEVFVDPTSGLLMRVYEDPRTGERRYRAEG
jgi:hypothetical protein